MIKDDIRVLWRKEAREECGSNTEPAHILLFPRLLGTLRPRFVTETQG